MDDHELLREYIERRSQDAFRELVGRHIRMVYASACRMLTDPQLAEDVAQAVFTTLAQKAEALRPTQVLAGWLYNTTRHLAMHALRKEQRRRAREKEVVIMQLLDSSARPDRIIELLEPALAELEEEERDALVLRFFEDRSLRELGSELGISEDAARMRVSRALERLRGVLQRQGVAVTSAFLAATLTALTGPIAPAALATSITTNALAGTAPTTATVIAGIKWLTLAKALILLVGAGAIIGLPVVRGWLGFHAPSGIVRLADVREVVLRRVTYGQSHRYVFGNPVAKALVSLGATNWAGRLGAKTFGHTSKKDELMVWIELRGRSLSTNGVQATCLTVLDSEGHESNRNPMAPGVALPGVALYGFAVSSFPRRDQSFTLRFWGIEKADYIPLADFKVRNPARGPFPLWTPEALPIERRAGDEVFTLAGFSTGLSATGVVVQYWGRSATELLFRIGTNEAGFRGTNRPESGVWSIAKVELSDAAGNVLDHMWGRTVSQTASQFMARTDDGGANVAGFCWTNESAWKIRAVFEQANRWLVNGIALPPPGTYQEINVRTQIDGVALVLKGIAAANVPFPAERGSRAASAGTRPRIHLDFDPGTNVLLLNLNYVLDQRRRKVGWERASSARGERAFSLQTSPDASELDFGFTLLRSCELEFLAKPSLLVTNVAHWGDAY